MTFTITKASTRDYDKNHATIDIESINDLRELYDHYGKNDIIIDFDEMTITIYDDDIE